MLSNESETTIEGLDEVLANLQALPPKIQQSAVRPALNAGAQVFEAALLNTVPRGATGALAESIDRKIHVSANLNDMSAIVGPRYMGGYTPTSNDPGVRAQFLEFGTRKMAPRFWMSKAYQSAKQTATGAAVAVLKTIVDALK
jgi:HK97 gp10 family phage protein